MRRKKLLSVILAAAMVLNMGSIAGAAEFKENAEAVSEAEPFVTEIPGTTTIKEDYNKKFDYVTGFAMGKVTATDGTVSALDGKVTATDGTVSALDGKVTATDGVKDRAEYLGTGYYRKVGSGSEFAKAIKDARDGKVKIIELTADINLGYDNFTAEEQEEYKSFLTRYKKPTANQSIASYQEFGGFTNPEALKNGVSSFKISNVNGLTIFSTSGNSISYAEINLNRGANDIVIRNVHFKNMWQWDDDGNQKAVGWSNLKLNEGHNIWIDHCSFDAAFDGNIDIENGAAGISITWCKIGQTPDEALEPGSAIYNSITFMESLYNEGKLSRGLYKTMRDRNATPEQIMQYSAYHDKCHLCGSGDKDCVDASDAIKDSNGNIRVTFAYNHYLSIGQRLPMIRQGVGHMYNCYIDDTPRQEVLSVQAINDCAPSNYKMSRCINARNGACIAADTCVFNGVADPIIGAESQGQDLGNMDQRYQVFFKQAVNRSLIVNSKVVNTKGTYVGSSWDNNGKNAFITSKFVWKDKSTIGNWAWSSKITNLGTYTKEDINKKVEPYEFEFEYDTDEKLPYEYRVMPLEKVEEVVTERAGAGSVIKSVKDWCLVSSSESESDISPVIPKPTKIPTEAPTATVSAPAATVSAPAATVSAPTATVSAPAATVSAPTATVSAPTATVSVPTATVSAPTATVSAPTATVSAPTATVSAPQATATAAPKVKVENAVFASKSDNFAPAAAESKVNKLVLDFSTVSGSGVASDKLSLTTVKSAKFTTKDAVESAVSSDKKALKVKVNKKTGIASVAAKASGIVEFKMKSGAVYKVTFNVENPKANKEYKNIAVASGGESKVLGVSELFGTKLDNGKLEVSCKENTAKVENNRLVVTPTVKDTIKVTYSYLNKKYKLSIKVK